MDEVFILVLGFFCLYFNKNGVYVIPVSKVTPDPLSMFSRFPRTVRSSVRKGSLGRRFWNSSSFFILWYVCIRILIALNWGALLNFMSFLAFQMLLFAVDVR